MSSIRHHVIRSAEAGQSLYIFRIRYFCTKRDPVIVNAKSRAINAIGRGPIWSQNLESEGNQTEGSVILRYPLICLVKEQKP